MLFAETSDFLRCYPKSIAVMYFLPLMCLFWSKHKIFCFFFYCYASNNQLIFLFQKIRSLFIFAASVMSVPLTNWLIWLVYQFRFVNFININCYSQLAIIINYKVLQDMFKNVPHIKKNVARIQLKHLLHFNSWGAVY